MNEVSVLIVDDDQQIRELLGEFLRENLFLVVEAENTIQAAKQIAEANPDIMLLDLRMPGEDGVAFCRRIRDTFKKPIIMLSAVRDEIEQVIAHEMGVDDYLVKPYNNRILLAKIKSALRRYNQLTSTPEDESNEIHLYTFDKWTLDTQTRTITSHDEVIISLSSAEYSLLVTLVEHPNRVLSRDQLIELTKSDVADVFDRSIDVLISRLRNKLDDTKKPNTIIQTVRGGGYLFLPKLKYR
jgi:two-component system OmpR family response regulator